jgi:hypothetical protein
MKMFSITLGNRAGEIEVHGEADWLNNSADFNVTANGLKVFTSKDYTEASAVATETFEINKSVQDNNKQWQ